MCGIMSLNGLDMGAVNDAYKAALAEPSGWFLLRYASRDEVTLLEQGDGDFTEVKVALFNFKEKSPIYGFIRHEGRNVLLKYIPDGTSRLLKGTFEYPLTGSCN